MINFAAIDRLDILESLFTTLTIPPAVQHELLERGAEYPHMTIIPQFFVSFYALCFFLLLLLGCRGRRRAPGAWAER